MTRASKTFKIKIGVVRDGVANFGIFPMKIKIFGYSVGGTVAERLACSPPTRANRVQSPTGSLPDFRSHVGITQDNAAGRRVFLGISRFPTLSYWCCSILTSITPICSQDLTHPFTHSLRLHFLRATYRRENKSVAVVFSDSVCRCRNTGTDFSSRIVAFYQSWEKYEGERGMDEPTNGARSRRRWRGRIGAVMATERLALGAAVAERPRITVNDELDGDLNETILCSARGWRFRGFGGVSPQRSKWGRALAELLSSCPAAPRPNCLPAARRWREGLGGGDDDRDSATEQVNCTEIEPPLAPRTQFSSVSIVQGAVLQAVHDKVSSLEMKLRKISLPLHAYIFMGALNDIRPVKLVTMAEMSEVLTLPRRANSREVIELEWITGQTLHRNSRHSSFRPVVILRGHWFGSRVDGSGNSEDSGMQLGLGSRDPCPLTSDAAPAILDDVATLTPRVASSAAKCLQVRCLAGLEELMSSIVHERLPTEVWIGSWLPALPFPSPPDHVCDPEVKKSVYTPSPLPAPRQCALPRAAYDRQIWCQLPSCIHIGGLPATPSHLNHPSPHFTLAFRDGPTPQCQPPLHPLPSSAECEVLGVSHLYVLDCHFSPLIQDGGDSDTGVQMASEVPASPPHLPPPPSPERVSFPETKTVCLPN
ncbi:hypothetical protein PR048_028747 [Dryococelus australis]|uniref:Uncharacterized protein n=1 Tax=Dryococelus australis TaxID=614101 RepID=A0ABQ9GBE3_9NEOP|nr:hypothetical protein PR048_028747 [Dryococelus australis]